MGETRQQQGEQAGQPVEEPGRTATEAEGGEVSPKFPDEESRTASDPEGDRDTVEESLRQKGLH